LAETLVANYVGGVIFTGDAAIAMCIANKVAGVRAAYVVNVIQATRAKKNLGANLFAIEMPGPTFFEMRQMLKTIVTSPVQCPDEVVKTLKELDGHAHR
jgi:ribose 5-phosphate isomerase RpiB